MLVRPLTASCLAFLATVSASAAERSLSVTIYNDDLALIQDRRDIDIAGGRAEQPLRDGLPVSRALRRLDQPQCSRGIRSRD
jgi:hypothetical protein